MKPFTALEALAMRKIVGILQNAIQGMPSASFWARELGMTEMESELIEIQNALVSNRESLLALIKTAPAMPDDNKSKKAEAA